MSWIDRMLRRPSRAELEARTRELESEISEKESRTRELESEISEKESQIDERKSRMSELDDAIDERDAEKDRLRTRIAAMTDDEDGGHELPAASEEMIQLLRRARADDAEGRMDFMQLEESMLKASHKLSAELLAKALEDKKAGRK